MRTRRTRRNQQGSVLILTLVFLALFGTVVGLMLSFGQVGIKLHNSEATKSHSIYAADGAIQYGIAQAKANNGVCPSNMTGAGLPLAGTIALPKDVSNVNITCQQYTGTGTNTFGGYAVVAGVNVNSSGAYVVNNCSPQQTSISSDPVGSGAPTFASGTRTCQKYPGGGTPPSWTSNVTPNAASPGTNDATASVNGNFMLTPIEQWFVGTHVVSGSTVPFVWFAPDSDDIVDATGSGGGTPLPSNFAPTKVWAAGFNAVFVIGTQAGAGAVYFSGNSENAATPGGVVGWSNMAIPNAKTLTDIYGLPGDAGNVWAVGTTTAAGNPGGVWYFNGATWTLAATLKSSTAANGVWAADATHVWVAGTSGGLGAIWTNTNWATNVTTVPGTISLADVRGVDATHVWAAGSSTTKGAIATLSGGAWGVATFTGTTAFKAFVPLSTTDLWVVGANGTNAQIWCNDPNTVAGTCSPANNTWQTQVLPVTVPPLPALNDASGVKVVTGGSITYVISAVGSGGTVLSYAPLGAAGTCTPCLARVQGSVFNANATNLPSGLCLSLSTSADCRHAQYTGSFTQYQASGCVARPANLAPNAAPAVPVPYSCTATLPSFAAKPLPTTKPAVAANQAGTSVAPSGACTTGYTYFTPGTYNQAINFSPHRTYFFESGVYVIEGNSSATGGFGAFDNLTNPPAANDLYVIGGKPSPGDVPAFVGPTGSPCWAAIQANSPVWNGGSGTGIELIMAKSTWLDVHTVNLELFTREGGNVATEGPQGISVRDVSGVTAASSPWGSDLNNRPAPNMVLQVDANSPLHYPNVYVHGSIFLPNENVEEYTNPQASLSGPVLGAIFANSIEFSYAGSSQPPLIVSSGSAGAPTAVFTATTGAVQIQAFVPFDATTTPATAQLDPAKGYSYRVLSPS